MPFRRESAAPVLSFANPLDLLRYFDDLEFLFLKHNISDDQEKKQAAVYYPSVEVERDWRYEDAFEDPAASYAQFKARIIALYPETAAALNPSFTDLERLVMDRAWKPILSTAELGKYYREFRKISQSLIGRHQISSGYQARQLFASFEPCLASSVHTRLMCKFPNRRPDDLYVTSDIYEAALYVLALQPDSPPQATAERSHTTLPPVQTVSTPPGPLRPTIYTFPHTQHSSPPAPPKPNLTTAGAISEAISALKSDLEALISANHSPLPLPPPGSRPFSTTPQSLTLQLERDPGQADPKKIEHCQVPLVPILATCGAAAPSEIVQQISGLNNRLEPQTKDLTTHSSHSTSAAAGIIPVGRPGSVRTSLTISEPIIALENSRKAAATHTQPTDPPGLSQVSPSDTATKTSLRRVGAASPIVPDTPSTSPTPRAAGLTSVARSSGPSLSITSPLVIGNPADSEAQSESPGGDFLKRAEPLQPINPPCTRACNDDHSDLPRVPESSLFDLQPPSVTDVTRTWPRWPQSIFTQPIPMRPQQRQILRRLSQQPFQPLPLTTAVIANSDSEPDSDTEKPMNQCQVMALQLLYHPPEPPNSKMACYTPSPLSLRTRPERRLSCAVTFALALLFTFTFTLVFVLSCPPSFALVSHRLPVAWLSQPLSLAGSPSTSPFRTSIVLHHSPGPLQQDHFTTRSRESPAPSRNKLLEQAFSFGMPLHRRHYQPRPARNSVRIEPAHPRRPSAVIASAQIDRPAESLQNKLFSTLPHTHGSQRRRRMRADRLSSFKGPPSISATYMSVHIPRKDVRVHVFSLFQQPLNEDPSDVRKRFAIEPPARTSLRRSRVLPNLPPAIYGVHTIRGDVRECSASTSTATSVQSKTASRATQFSDQPRMRRPSRRTGELIKTILLFDPVFRLRKSVHDSDFGPAAIAQFLPKVLKTVRVKTRKRTRHVCADVETWFEGAGLCPAPTPVSTNPRGDVRGYLCVNFRSNPLKGRQLYFRPVCERATHAHVFALWMRVPPSTISHVWRLLVLRRHAHRPRYDFDNNNGPEGSSATIGPIEGRPRARRPSRSIYALTRSTLSFIQVSWPRRGVRDNDFELAASGQIVPKEWRTAQVKTRKRPCHVSAELRTLVEDVGSSHAPALALTNPAATCKAKRDKLSRPVTLSSQVQAFSTSAVVPHSRGRLRHSKRLVMMLSTPDSVSYPRGNVRDPSGSSQTSSTHSISSHLCPSSTPGLQRPRLQVLDILDPEKHSSPLLHAVPDLPSSPGRHKPLELSQPGGLHQQTSVIPGTSTRTRTSCPGCSSRQPGHTRRTTKHRPDPRIVTGGSQIFSWGRNQACPLHISFSFPWPQACLLTPISALVFDSRASSNAVPHTFTFPTFSIFQHQNFRPPATITTRMARTAVAHRLWRLADSSRMVLGINICIIKLHGAVQQGQVSITRRQPGSVLHVSLHLGGLARTPAASIGNNNHTMYQRRRFRLPRRDAEQTRPDSNRSSWIRTPCPSLLQSYSRNRRAPLRTSYTGSADPSRHLYQVSSYVEPGVYTNSPFIFAPLLSPCHLRHTCLFPFREPDSHTILICLASPVTEDSQYLSWGRMIRPVCLWPFKPAFLLFLLGFRSYWPRNRQPGSPTSAEVAGGAGTSAGSGRTKAADLQTLTLHRILRPEQEASGPQEAAGLGLGNRGKVGR